jgi:hypothetical protein
MTFKILMCDLVGLRFDAAGQPDPFEVRNHIEQKGGVFHFGEMDASVSDGKLHFYYIPDISQADELRRLTDRGQFDAVIAAATFIPAECIFAKGGVRIGAGTGNMGSQSWGGGNGLGGIAPLMNTPGFNARATAQMAMRFTPALWRVILIPEKISEISRRLN